MPNTALVLEKPQGDFIFQDRAIPQAGADQIVVRNHAVSLAPIMLKLIGTPGFAESNGYKSWPLVLSSELAGVVESVGANITHFKPGDRVMGFSLPRAGADHGALQDFTVVDSYLASKIPDSMTFREACILPCSMITALGLLLDVGFELDATAPADNRSGEALLIWGGSGAVGSSTIQVAKALRAMVVTTASAQHTEYLRGLGADIVVDRNSASLVEDLKQQTSAAGLKITRFVDANSADLPTTVNAISALGGGDLATVLPWEMMNKTDPPSNVRPFMSGARRLIQDQSIATKSMHEVVEDWLVSKKVIPTNLVVVPGGLHGVEAGLARLKKGLSGVKLVIDIVP